MKSKERERERERERGKRANDWMERYKDTEMKRWREKQINCSENAFVDHVLKGINWLNEKLKYKHTFWNSK